ncbi:MAG: hypothetical protein ACYTAO_21520 [Planctomycetota bacterium]|jgi:hypothetical protein
MSDVGRKSVLIILANLPLYMLWGWVLFRSWGAFGDAVCFLFKPDCWSFIDGEYWDDIIAEGKLAIWFIVPLLLIRLELRLFLGI